MHVAAAGPESADLLGLTCLLGRLHLNQLHLQRLMGGRRATAAQDSLCNCLHGILHQALYRCEAGMRQHMHSRGHNDMPYRHGGRGSLQRAACLAGLCNAVRHYVHRPAGSCASQQEPAEAAGSPVAPAMAVHRRQGQLRGSHQMQLAGHGQQAAHQAGLQRCA